MGGEARRGGGARRRGETADGDDGHINPRVKRRVFPIFLTSPSHAKQVKLEDQPVGVQLMYHWTGILTLISIVVGVIGALFGFLTWLQARKTNKVQAAVDQEG